MNERSVSMLPVHWAELDSMISANVQAGNVSNPFVHSVFIPSEVMGSALIDIESRKSRSRSRNTLQKSYPLSMSTLRGMCALPYCRRTTSSL